MKNEIQSTLIFKAIVLANAISGMPKSLSNSLQQAYKQGHRRDALGVSVWALRQKFNFGVRKTTVNPVALCTSIEDTEYLLKCVQASSRRSVNSNSVEIAYSLRKALESEGVLHDVGELSNRQALQNSINEVLINQVNKGNVSGSGIEPRIIYEIEGRPANDAKVRALVHDSLQSAIECSLAKDIKKQNALNQSDYLSVLIEIQKLAGNENIKAFLSGVTLLSVIRDKCVCLSKPELHLGTLCDVEQFEKLNHILSLSVGYKPTANTSPETVLIFKHTNGLKISIWRYIKNGAYYTYRDAVHSWHNLMFDVRAYRFNEHTCWVPDNFEGYLAEQFGTHWRERALFRDAAFDLANIDYNNTPESLEYLTQRIVRGVGKNHRRVVCRAIDDLRDYFGIDYTGFIPTSERNVTTPASIRRDNEEPLFESPVLLLCRPTSVDYKLINHINKLAEDHDHITIGIPSSRAADDALSVIAFEYILRTLANIADVHVFHSREEIEAYASDNDIAYHDEVTTIAFIQTMDDPVVEPVHAKEAGAIS